MDLPLRRRSLNNLYQDVLERILQYGDAVQPRGMKTLEVRGVTLELVKPESNVITHPTRNLNYGFMLAEWLWIATARNDVALIEEFNSRMREFSDNGLTLAGAYGPKLGKQLAYCLRVLQHDPNSRQAICSLWERCPLPSKDIPCTSLFQFMLREGRLELIVYMRSNDAWLGLPYDVFTFTQLQRQMAAALGVAAGTYRHVVGSLHLYEQHWGKAAEVVAADPLDDGPKMLGISPDPGARGPENLEHLLEKVAFGPGLAAGELDALGPAYAGALDALQAYQNGERGYALLEVLNAGR